MKANEVKCGQKKSDEVKCGQMRSINNKPYAKHCEGERRRKNETEF